MSGVARVRDRRSSDMSGSPRILWAGMSGRCPTCTTVLALAGRQVSERVRHLLDLPGGYHTAPRAQAWQRRRWLGGKLRPGCRAVGRCQVEEMALRPRCVGRSIPGAGRVSVADTGRRGASRTGRSEGTRRYQSGGDVTMLPGSHRRGRTRPHQGVDARRSMRCRVGRLLHGLRREKSCHLG